MYTAAERDAKALNAASMFELDDVIDPAETRGVIVATLRAAAARAAPRTGAGERAPHRFVDTW